MSQSLKYGGIHGSHFEYIQTTVTFLFLDRFWKASHQNKWLAKALYSKTYLQLILRLLQDILTAYIAFPFKYVVVTSRFLKPKSWRFSAKFANKMRF